jgi:NodT family efflux transporter outer membrane factor (OMF) lipoprotein
MNSCRMKSLTLASAFVLLAGCVVGPDYVRPEAPVPATYQELGDWKPAQPGDQLSRGKWWEIFGDPLLNELEAQVAISNQNVLFAEAQFRQARALVQAARAGYFPTLSGTASWKRNEASQNRGQSTASGSGIGNSNLLTLDATWELDLWGRVRRTVESNEAGAQATAADVETVLLSTQAALAQDYFLLRAADAQQQLLDDTVAAYAKSLQLVRNQYAVGVAGKTEIALAETQLDSTQAQAIEVSVQRAQLEHAIALLIGRPPSGFTIARAPLNASPPPVPVGVPSELLERRPDVAGAERRVAAANAQIGVAKSAYFPALTLAATGGFQSAHISNLLTAPSRLWALGPVLAQVLFDGGLRQAQNDQAWAIYDATVATYRQTVLTGFQEVEDNLAALRILEQEAGVQDQAVRAARQSVTLTTNQYKAGIINYLAVVVVQAGALANERTAVDILGRRLTASVLLVKALGGGWSVTQLPGPGQLAGP